MPAFTPPAADRRRAGFTMLEILLAMGIFALGFIFIAAMFPAAIVLQKQTADNVLARQAARSAEAMLRGRVLHESELEDTGYGLTHYYTTAWDTSELVYPLPAGMLAKSPAGGDPASTGSGCWTLNDRSFPSNEPTVTSRRIYWVPLIQDADPGSGTSNRIWRLYVFVLLRWPNVNYNDPAVTNRRFWANPDDSDSVPRVRWASVAPSNADLARLNFTTANYNQDSDGDGLLDHLVVGDQFLDSNGNVYTVTEADADGVKVAGQLSNYPHTINGIWYAWPGLDTGTGQPSGRQSPTMMIIPLPDGGTAGDIVKP